MVCHRDSSRQAFELKLLFVHDHVSLKSFKCIFRRLGGVRAEGKVVSTGQDRQTSV